MSSKTNMKRLLLFAAFAFGVLDLAGCGGGSTTATTTPTPPTSPTTTSAAAITGTAATGLPISSSMNGTVTIKGTNGAIASTPTDSSGSYSFTAAQLANLTAPYVLQISYQVAGVTYYLHSAATAQDLQTQPATINITPLTDLVVANVAHDIAANVFRNPGNYSLTSTALEAGASALAAQIAPLLQAQNLQSSLDLLHQSFTADGSGLDAVLDSLRVTTDPVTKTAQITNTLNGSTIVNDLTASPTANTTVITVNPGDAPVTDFQAIQAYFSNLAAEIPKAASASDPALLGYFDQANFRDDGKGLASFLQEITTSPQIVGSALQLIDIELDPVPAWVTTVPGSATASYRVRFTVLQNNAPQERHQFMMYKTAGGTWLSLGNQLVAKIRLHALETMTPISNGTGTTIATCTGLGPEVEDKGGLGLTYALITYTPANTSLSPQTLLMYNDGSSYFQIANGGPSTFAGTNTPMTTAGQQCGFSSIIPLTDTQIGNMSLDDTYTIRLFTNASYSPGNTPVATYVTKLSELPLKSTDMSAAQFASNGAASPHLLTAAAASSATTSQLTWTAPTTTGLYANNVYIYIQDGTSAGSSASVDLAADATSASVAIPMVSAPTQADMTVTYFDAAFRHYWTGFMNP